jgi:hypothetical protein
VAAGGKGFVIELTWILEITDAAHPGFEFDPLTVGQVGRRLAGANSQARPDAGFGRKFKNELLIFIIAALRKR